MNYLTLRDCYVNDRLWREGVIYDLPETMNISPKNFKSLEVAEVKAEDKEVATPIVEPVGEVVKESEVSIPKETKPRKRHKKRSHKEMKDASIGRSA